MGAALWGGEAVAPGVSVTAGLQMNLGHPEDVGHQNGRLVPTGLHRNRHPVADAFAAAFFCFL